MCEWAEEDHRKTEIPGHENRGFFLPFGGKTHFRRLFNQSVFDLDTIQFFQHGLGGDENEDYCGGGMD